MKHFCTICGERGVIIYEAFFNEGVFLRVCVTCAAPVFQHLIDSLEEPHSTYFKNKYARSLP